MDGDDHPTVEHHSSTPRIIRQATLILPSTGERLRRDFTLRDPRIANDTNSQNGANNAATERTPLLSPKSDQSKLRRIYEKTLSLAKTQAEQGRAFADSTTGKDVFKCSLAYLIATLFTFAPPIASILGAHQDGNQLVANIVVWFDPARATGSMDKGVIVACIAFLYAVFVCFSSMGVSVFFEYQHLIAIGHIIILIIFVAGGLGFIGWIKQRLSDPLVNVGCSLASLAIVIVITKEGAVQEGEFSYYRVFQVLKMLIVGIVISTVVNLVVWPVSARKELRDNLIKTTDNFSELLTAITSSFLSGLEEDLTHPLVVTATENLKGCFKSLPKNLRESRYEHYLVGTEGEFHIEKRLVACMQRLYQDLGGLRSAAETQFNLLAPKDDLASPLMMITPITTRNTTLSDLFPQGIERENQNSDNSSNHSGNSGSSGPHTPEVIFEKFITNLGPPMKSLAYTLKEILDELPYGPGPEHAIVNHPKFRPSLTEAINLFIRSRKEALDLVYSSKGLKEANTIEAAADFEEVAASCGYFSSSLQDFAENCLNYLDILDELELEVSERPNGRTWAWLLFWRRWKSSSTSEDEPAFHSEQTEAAFGKTLPDPRRHTPQPGTTGRTSSRRKFPYFIWPYLRFIRREDIRFAIKVGVGAALWAMFSFIPETQSFYMKWHLEWGLVSFMLVCSMTIGASNTTGWSRFRGTIAGALAAMLIWVIARGNPYVLAFLGWIVSLFCFYYIKAKGQGPMGRFILLTYNLSVLYAYAQSINDPDTRPIIGGINPHIWEVASHRVVAVIAGCVAGIIVTRFIWPISARKKLPNGISLLWLRMGLMWKRSPISMIMEGETSPPSYMDIRAETELRDFLDTLESLRVNAESEFSFKGPFPAKSFEGILKSTGRMLDAFHALNVVISKDLKASPGEAAILSDTRDEREHLATRICHLLSVLASSIKMQYPLNDTLPSIIHPRDRLLAKLFAFRKDETKSQIPTEEDYELVYAVALATGQIAKEIRVAGKEIETLYGVLSEDVLKLQ